MAKGIMILETYPVSPEQEAEYNEWYDNVHLQEVCALPGFLGARRYAPSGPGAPYLAIYEIESDDVQKAVADMKEQAANGAFTSTDALRRNPPPVSRVVVEIANHAA